MKEKDPKGYKELEQKLELSNFDTKNRKKNASGGIARANFVGGGMGRRGFLKLLAGAGAGIGALKTGILGLGGKQAGKEVVKEVVKQSAGTPPPYFFKLAEKIKMLGDDVTATTDRTISKSLKSKDGKSDYILEEDVATGDTIIKKVNKEGDEMITDVQIMELRKGEVVKGKDGKALKTPDEYEEVTEANMRIEGDTFNDPYYSDGIEEIEMKKIIDEVGEQAPSIKKADGGIMRAGYQMGGDVAYDATNQDIYGSSAITVTPDTVMDQFGNQVQAEMGKRPITAFAPGTSAVDDRGISIMPSRPSKIPGGITDIPAAGGGLNNPDPKYSSFEEAFDAYKDNPIVGKDIASGDLSFKDFSNQMNLNSGFFGMHGAGGVPAGGNFGGFGGYSFNDETNKITRRPSPQVNMPLGLLQPALQPALQQPTNATMGESGKQMPIGQPLASGDGTKSEYYRGKDYGPKQSTSLTKQGMPLTQELKSQQLAAVYGDSPLASTVRTNMLSGGIARMLGE